MKVKDIYLLLDPQGSVLVLPVHLGLEEWFLVEKHERLL